jgi:hypothetical protein
MASGCYFIPESFCIALIDGALSKANQGNTNLFANYLVILKGKEFQKAKNEILNLHYGIDPTLVSNEGLNLPDIPDSFLARV